MEIEQLVLLRLRYLEIVSQRDGNASIEKLIEIADKLYQFVKDGRSK